MIAIKNLTYSINKNTLFSGLTFEGASGNILQILGSNGSGKTTLLKILSGITEPTKGDLEIIGSPKKLFLGHKIPIKDYFTNLQNFLSLNPDASESNFNQYCEQVNLSTSKTLLSSALSFGQKKKLLLSKIFLSSYDVLFLDEPFVGLDRETIGIIKDRILEMKANGTTIFLTSHQEVLDGDVVINLDSGLITK
jgi:ABC-type multidrug transport system ATPase subunit